MQRCSWNSKSSAQNETGYRNVKNSKKWLFRYIGSKEKENIGTLLYGRGELVTSNEEKAAVLDTSLTSVLTNTVEPQTLGAKLWVDANTDWPSLMEELQLNCYRSLALQINGPWYCPPEGVRSAGWCCCKTLHNPLHILWEIVEIRGYARKLEER